MEGHRKFLGGGGWGEVLEGKILEAEYEAKPGISWGEGGCKTNNLLWGEYGNFLELLNIILF